MNTESKSNTQSRQTVLAMTLLLAMVAVGALWFSGTPRSDDTVFTAALRKSQLTAGMRADLFAAAEAEKSAVLAETDEASRDFARQAHAQVALVASGLATLQELASASGEAPLVKRFADAFAEYLAVDAEVLELAVQNTNLKAFALSFGESAKALADMEAALRPFMNGPEGTGDKTARLAQRALLEALRIQALHAPHVMEKDDAQMDALERDMARADASVRAALAGLGGTDGARLALAAYQRYGKLNVQIVALSRRNTNLRSLMLTLERKTKVLAACDEALRALEAELRGKMGTRATR